MARARSPNRDKAYEIYKDNNGSITNKSIADILNENEKTISSWKCRDKWNVVLQKNECSTTNKKVSQNNKKVEKEKPIAEEVKEVLENAKLTDKQRLFCVIYSQCMNAAKAYQKAYNCTYETAMVEGSKNLRKPKIKEQIDQLISSQLNKEFLRRNLIQKYIDIAFCNITDYVHFGKKYELVYDKEGNVKLDEEGNPITRTYNYMELEESNKVDGTLISEISEGREGIKIKLLDKMKAMEFLSKHCDLLNEKEKAELEVLKAKVDKKDLEPITINFVKASEKNDNS